jgi:hypothetical protein
VRRFLANVEEHGAACSFLRAEGATPDVASEVAWPLFLLKMHEAFAQRGVVTSVNFWWADPQPRAVPHKFVDWTRAAADRKSLPGDVAAFREVLRAARRSAEQGARDSAQHERLERGLDLVPPAPPADPAPPAPRVFGDSTHYPSSVARGAVERSYSPAPEPPPPVQPAPTMGPRPRAAAFAATVAPLFGRWGRK